MHLEYDLISVVKEQWRNIRVPVWRKHHAHDHSAVWL